MTQLEKLQVRVTECNRCPRLRTYCSEIGKTKKREFKDWEYWARPVPSFGDPFARLWIVGLAPAAHGANRTGRMFTGDSSGRWLYKALYKTGFANLETSVSRSDGLSLKDCFISAAAHCAPPDNKPLPEELLRCSSFLEEEFLLLKNKQLILALGKIAFDSVLKLLLKYGFELPSPKPKFGHGLFYDFGPLAVLASYHPSRQNTQTGRLTEAMWNNIFLRSKSRIGLKNHSFGKSNLVRSLKPNKLNIPSSLG